MDDWDGKKGVAGRESVERRELRGQLWMAGWIWTPHLPHELSKGRVSIASLACVCARPAAVAGSVPATVASWSAHWLVAGTATSSCGRERPRAPGWSAAAATRAVWRSNLTWSLPLRAQHRGRALRRAACQGPPTPSCLMAGLAHGSRPLPSAQGSSTGTSSASASHKRPRHWPLATSSNTSMAAPQTLSCAFASLQVLARYCCCASRWLALASTSLSRKDATPPNAAGERHLQHCGTLASN